MTRHRQTVEVPKAEASVYLKKAAEFRKAAEATLAGGNRNAAGLLAIHAGICAADAITVFYLGLRSTGRRHLDVVALLGQTGHPGKDALERRLNELLSEKTSVEYEGRLISVGDCVRMVKLSSRIVDAAGEAVG